jgi:hypothetical protein
VGKVGSHDLVRDAEQAAQQPAELGLQPHERSARPVGEGDDADAVVGSHQELGVEPWQHPFVPDDAMPARVAAEEREADPRQARVGLVVVLKHGRERRRLDH